MNILDIFSGIGAFSVGLEKSGMKTVAFCEKNLKKWPSLQRNWPGVPIIRDVKDVNLRSLYELGIPKIDVICCGFPCDDISPLGSGEGIEGEKSSIWSEAARIIQEVKPKYVVIENSSLLRTRGLGKVLADLTSMGFSADWGPISAESVGAPHQRDRMWVVAYREWEPVVFSGDCFVEDESDESVCSHCREDYAGCTCFGPHSVDDAGWELVEEDWGLVAYPRGFRREEQCWHVPVLPESLAAECFDWYEHEPSFPRVDDGIANRSQRVSHLGDAVVTWIPYLIGKALIELDRQLPKP